MVGIQIFTHGRVQTGGTFAQSANVQVFASHRVHIGRGSPQVGYGSLEIRHLAHVLYFTQDGLFGTGSNKFSLMSRDRAKGTSPETSAMQGDGMSNHVVCRYFLVLVFRVRQSGEREIVNGIYLVRGHGRIGRVHDDKFVLNRLYQFGGVNTIGFFFDIPEIRGVFLFIRQAFLV